MSRGFAALTGPLCGLSADAFAYVSDLTPTLLELAGVPAHQGSHGGRKVHEITGKSIVSLLRGETERAHEPNDPVAYELAGSAAVFRGDYKLLRNNPTFGDKKWRLYRYTSDPLELDDLTKSEPKLFAEMKAAYNDYAKEVNLIEVPDDYNPVTQIQKNVKRNQGEEQEKKVPILD